MPQVTLLLVKTILELHFQSGIGLIAPHQPCACRQDKGLHGLCILQLDNQTKGDAELTLAGSLVHIVYRHKHRKKYCTVRNHLTGSD